MSRRVARVARPARHWSADALGNVSGLLTARRTPIFARFGSTHARTTLCSFWTEVLDVHSAARYVFGMAGGTGSPLRIVRLGIRGALIGSRAGTLPPDASQPSAPEKAALAGEGGDGVAHLFGGRTESRELGTRPQHPARP